MHKRILVTGGAGFIGSAFIRYLLREIVSCEWVINLDLLTYASNLDNLKEVEIDPRYHLIQGNILDTDLVHALCKKYQIELIVHFAAETHVDQSIQNPVPFYRTNVEGTLALLEVVRKNPHIHLHHISTDEVYGSLDSTGFFTEESPYLPSSPYSASKASADHFVRAYHRTYGIHTTLSHCSNNYGPGQHSEKLIPLAISHLIEKRPIPVYGKGENVRDWLYVDDHVEAIWSIVQKGKSGESYCISAGCEMANIHLLKLLIALFARARGEAITEYEKLLTYVADRPGHDFRYAIDAAKLRRVAHWSPRYCLQEGLAKTLDWSLSKHSSVSN